MIQRDVTATHVPGEGERREGKNPPSCVWSERDDHSEIEKSSGANVGSCDGFAGRKERQSDINRG